jgi:hypothetical protein
MINLPLALKNLKKKNVSKTKINLKQKIPLARICFLTNFKCKKSHNINSYHKMKSFDMDIIRFGDINRCQ